MVAVKLPDTMSESMMFENIYCLLDRLLEWLVILVGCNMKGINELARCK